MKIALQFWSDEGGSVSPFATILMMLLLVIALIPGLVTVRDQVVQTFGDAAVALESLDQSYSFTVNGDTSVYVDTITVEDMSGDPPAGLDLTIPPTPEG